MFTSLYEKKEGIDFLLSKINQDIIKTKQDIKALYKKINPNNRTIPNRFIYLFIVDTKTKGITLRNIEETEA